MIVFAIHLLGIVRNMADKVSLERQETESHSTQLMRRTIISLVCVCVCVLFLVFVHFFRE